MEISLVVALIGVGGVLIAAILSSSGYLYRNIQEGKKSARKVLYHLLELRWAILKRSLTDPVEATDKYLEHMVSILNKRGGKISVSDFPETMIESIKVHFFEILNVDRNDIEKDLLPPYEESLLELAKTEPVLAYQLRDRQNFDMLIDHTKNYQIRMNKETLESIKENKEFKDIDTSLLNDQVSTVMDTNVTSVFKGLSDIIDADVLCLAKYCGRSDYRRCKKLLNKDINFDNKYDYKELDAYFNKILDDLINLQKQDKN